MKKLFKIIGVILLLIISAGIVTGIVLDEPLPKGEKGSKADALANKMLAALNPESYNKTSVITWSFRNGAHNYVWNKKGNTCKVSWEDYEITLDLIKPKRSKVKKGNVAVSENTEEIIKKAQDLFNNDSFWLVAPYKVFDTGTERRLVKLDDGSDALLITYTSGGSTPGDSYLWLLNDDGFPNAFKMWVDIIPIGGVKATWDDWLVTETGAFLPKSHKIGPLTLSMGNVSATN